MITITIIIRNILKKQNYRKALNKQRIYIELETVTTKKISVSSKSETPNG